MSTEAYENEIYYLDMISDQKFTYFFFHFDCNEMLYLGFLFYYFAKY